MKKRAGWLKLESVWMESIVTLPPASHRWPWAVQKAGGCPRRGMKQSEVIVARAEWSRVPDLGSRC